MCGIVGIIGKRKRLFFGLHLDIFEEMLWCDAIRGKDSTGAFTVLENSQVKLVKNEQSPEFLLGTKAWDKFRQTAITSGHVLVGHNRKATFGTTSRENAHPFAEENIILVHNGTITNHKEMKDTEVDSHAICHGIASQGYKEVLESLSGSFTLVWYDIITKKLYMIRNTERPLYFAENEDILAFASEGYMLGWLLSRNNIKFEKIHPLDPMELTTFEFGPYNVTTETIKKKTRSNPYAFWETTDNNDGQKDTMANNNSSGIVTFLDTVFDKYKLGEEIIFLPQGIEEDTILHGRWKIRGKAYLPGKPLLNDVTWLTPQNVEFEDAVELGQEEKLVGIIRSIHRSSDDVIYTYLQDVKADVILTFWNDNEIPRQEWKYIQKIYTCAKCNGPLDINKTLTTSILFDKEKVRCICHKCVEENVGEMPKDKVDAIKQASNTTV